MQALHPAPSLPPSCASHGVGMESDASQEVVQVYQSLMRRQAGLELPSLLQRRLVRRGNGSIELHRQKKVQSSATGSVNWMDLDVEEHRYLLCAESDGCAYLYDLDGAKREDGRGMNVHQPLCSTAPASEMQHARVSRRGPCSGHTASVLSIQYYPFDRGIFVTGSLDKTVKLWDTSIMEAATEYRLGSAVHAIGMSKVSTHHSLIAAGLTNGQISLCNIESGACICTLNEHRCPIGALKWHPGDEWILMSGAQDGRIKMWDIRKPTSVLTLFHGGTRSDQNNMDSATNGQQALTKISSPSSLKRDVKALREAKFMHKGKTSNVLPNATSTLHFPVVSLEFSHDGQYMFSCGKEGRLHSWDMAKACKTDKEYCSGIPHVSNQVQLAVAEDDSYIFVPSGNTIVSFDCRSGSRNAILKGHHNPVKCCRWRPHHQELISAALDRQVIVWTSPLLQRFEASHCVQEAEDRDDWSD